MLENTGNESVRLEKILFDHTKLKGDYWVVDGDLFIEIVCLNGCSNVIRCLCGKTFVVLSLQDLQDMLLIEYGVHGPWQ